MIRKIIAVQLFLLLLVGGCTNKKGETFAQITERKHLEGGKLKISYSFTNAGKLYNGDTTISNTVVPNDSLLVRFSSENPADSKLQIP